MNTLKVYEKISSRTATLLFLSIIFLFVGSTLPIINPVTPRLNSDLMAFLGLGLFGMVTCFYLPREATRFSLTSLGMLCGGWLIVGGMMVPLLLFIPGFVTTFAQGIALPNAQAGAIRVDPKLTGTASGIAAAWALRLAARLR